MRWRSTGMGSSVVGSRCSSRPSGRLSLIAACAAAIVRWRPSVMGSTVPGNRTRLRVGIRISVSSGSAAIPANAVSMAPGGGAATSSLVRRSWFSRGIRKILEFGSIARGARPSNLVQLQFQTAVRQVAAGNLEPSGRQLDPPLEMPLRYLQPVDPGVSDLERQRAFAADDQNAGAERHLDLVGLDPGQGDQDDQRLVALKNVARRLPGGCRGAAPKKLTMETLSAFHRFASLFPSQRFELS